MCGSPHGATAQQMLGICTINRLTPSQFFIPSLSINSFMLHPVKYFGVNLHSCTMMFCFTRPLSLVKAQSWESSKDLYMLFLSCGRDKGISSQHSSLCKACHFLCVSHLLISPHTYFNTILKARGTVWAVLSDWIFILACIDTSPGLCFDDIYLVKLAGHREGILDASHVGINIELYENTMGKKE